MGLKVIILAAGKGRRMMSDVPKVLHTVGGIPLLTHVVKTAQQLEANGIYIVYGNGGDTVHKVLENLPVNWIEQSQQLGTGHAVMQAMPYCEDSDQILILYGDVPLIAVDTLRRLLRDTPLNGLGLVVAEMADPTGFGRIIRNDVANIIGIVEHKDATDLQRQIKEINTGIMTMPAGQLKAWLPKLTNQNQQNEYYLTDIVALAVASGLPVGGVMVNRIEEIQGVNDRVQLASLERRYQRRFAKQLMLKGVTIADPRRIDIRGEVDIASDVTLDINVVLEGTVKIGKNCYIGANVVLRNATLGEHVIIEAHSVIDGAVIHSHCQVGPFARIRPGTVLDENVHVGNFVEVKKTSLGKGSKANHLAYLGDTIIGVGVNIGAGCITCNYDGANKWQTTIEDNAFIGSNTSLVAPLIVGTGATIGAGSTITRNVPAQQLTLSRSLQQSFANWKRPTKSENRSRRTED